MSSRALFRSRGQSRASDMRDNDFSATEFKGGVEAGLMGFAVAEFAKIRLCGGCPNSCEFSYEVGYTCGDGCDNPLSRRETTRGLACSSDISPFVESCPPFLRFVNLSLASTSATVPASAN